MNREKNLESLSQDYMYNYGLLKDSFKWSNGDLIAISALVAGVEEGKLDRDKIEIGERALKSNSGMFSIFRGTIKLPALVLLSMDKDPEKRFNDTLDYYETLKEEFFASEYLGLSALILSGLVEKNQVEVLARAGKSLYKRMKKNHPFLTSSEDNFLALLLGLSHQDEDTIVAKIEGVYELLRGDLGRSNHLQTASHILAFSEGEPAKPAQRLLDLVKGLKEAGLGFSKFQDYSSLASLSLGDRPIEDLLADIKEGDRILEAQTPYKGLFGISKNNRRNHAAILVGGLGQGPGQEAYQALASTIAMIAAQQAVMMAVIVSSSMTASTSNH